MDEVQETLRLFITENFLFGRDNEELADSDSLIEKGVIDSTGVLMLVSFLEKDMGVRVEDDEIIPDNLDTIDQLTAFVARKRASGETISASCGPCVALSLHEVA